MPGVERNGYRNTIVSFGEHIRRNAIEPGNLFLGDPSAKAPGYQAFRQASCGRESAGGALHCAQRPLRGKPQSGVLQRPALGVAGGDIHRACPMGLFSTARMIFLHIDFPPQSLNRKSSAHLEHNWRCNSPIRRDSNRAILPLADLFLPILEAGAIAWGHCSHNWRCDSPVRRTEGAKRLTDGFLRAWLSLIAICI